MFCHVDFICNHYRLRPTHTEKTRKFLEREKRQQVWRRTVVIVVCGGGCNGGWWWGGRRVLYRFHQQWPIDCQRTPYLTRLTTSNGLDGLESRRRLITRQEEQVGSDGQRSWETKRDKERKRLKWWRCSRGEQDVFRVAWLDTISFKEKHVCVYIYIYIYILSLSLYIYIYIALVKFGKRLEVWDILWDCLIDWLDGWFYGISTNIGSFNVEVSIF